MAARPTFDHELEQLNTDLIRMGALVEEAIEKVVSAFQNEDYQLAKSIVEHDRQINEIEKIIESRSLSLMLRQQPVAGDLRLVSTALKVVTDMERYGEEYKTDGTRCDPGFCRPRLGAGRRGCPAG